MNGKQFRLTRILSGGKAVLVPMDHGVSDGPIEGLENPEKAIEKAAKGGATGVILHKGLVKSLKSIPSCGLIMHASAGTSFSADPLEKVLVASPSEALFYGCDAFSVHVNVGGDDAEADMLSDLGEISDECDEWGLPLLAMMYARGANVKDEFDPEAVAHAARIGAELGADIVKTAYTGSSKSYERVVKGCPVPVVIAGGRKLKKDREVLEMVRGAMDAGAIGVSLGRNIFGHANTEKMTRAIRAIVVDNSGVDKALALLN